MNKVSSASELDDNQGFRGSMNMIKIVSPRADF